MLALGLPRNLASLLIGANDRFPFSSLFSHIKNLLKILGINNSIPHLRKKCKKVQEKHCINFLWEHHI